MTPRRRLLPLRVVLALAATLIALVVAEFGWRIVRAAAWSPTTNPLYVEHDPEWGWRYRAGAVARHESADFAVDVRIGPCGFREQPSLPSRAPTVVAVGDSLTFGWGVAGDETFAAVLERRLDAPVWNLGISGTGPGQQLLILRARGRVPVPDGASYAPRVVVVTHCTNDLDEVARATAYGRGKPRFARVEGGGVTRVTGPVEDPWLERVSTLWRSLRRRLAERQRPAPTPAEVDDARATIAALYVEMADTAATDGARLLVVAQSAPWLTDALPTRADLAFLDVGRALAAAVESSGQPVVFANDDHWNARGHEVVATAIEDEIVRLGWLR